MLLVYKTLPIFIHPIIPFNRDIFYYDSLHRNPIPRTTISLHLPYHTYNYHFNYVPLDFTFQHLRHITYTSSTLLNSPYHSQSQQFLSNPYCIILPTIITCTYFILSAICSSSHSQLLNLIFHSFFNLTLQYKCVSKT